MAKLCTFMHQLPCKKPCDEVEYQHKYKKKGKALYKSHSDESVPAEKEQKTKNEIFLHRKS